MITLPLALLSLLTLQLPVSWADLHRHSSRHHALAKLFNRQASQINSYPTLDVAGPAPRPEWLEAYQREKASGQIPAIKPSIKTLSGEILYDGVNGLDPSICSWTLGCRSPLDIYDAPSGMFGISFDDGPQEATETLLDFLQSVNQSATHFMIGSRILSNTEAFKTAVQRGQHIAVHTWSHPMMTTLTDEQVLGEIGWTLQVIYDLSGGKLPAYWRPPYGDVDNRVRAIAKFFGLKTIIWGGDTNDWCLTTQDTSTCGGEGPKNEAALEVELSDFIKSPKTPGLIILEHEITSISVKAFTKAYGQMKSAGWDTQCIPGLFKEHWYQNALGPFDQPIKLESILSATNLKIPEDSSEPVPSNQTTNRTINSSPLLTAVQKSTSSEEHKASVKSSGANGLRNMPTLYSFFIMTSYLFFSL